MKIKDLPEAVRADVPANHLRIEPLTGVRYLVVTENSGLILGVEAPERVWAWTDFLSGTWSREDNTFTARGIDTEDLVLSFTDEVDPVIGVILADRIDSSIVFEQSAPLGQTGWLRVFVRRNPDGTLYTQTVVAGGEGVPEAELHRLAESLEAEARSTAGMPI
ncbi:MAG: hypothetical protein Q4P33_03855 [Flaviflexus sp.]|nr:hypothetical protein [Flaviflexus sp.]